MEPIYFHAKKVNASYLALIRTAKDEEEDQDLRNEAYDKIAAWPKTHTFCFDNTDDGLRVTWAKVYDGDEWEEKGDIFSKKEGKRVSSTKMVRLISKPPRTVKSFSYYDGKFKAFIFEYLPACVANTLPWFVDKAKRYYKIDDMSKLVVVEASRGIDDFSDRKARMAISAPIEQFIVVSDNLRL